MFKNWKNFGILIVIVIIIMLVAVYYLYNKPHRNILNEESVISINAGNLFKNYEQNETDANKDFLDKTIEITGQISEINISEEENPVIIFKNKEDFFGVSCSFSSKMNQNLANIKIGDSIKVKGICKGYLSDVVLIDCIIVD